MMKTLLKHPLTSTLLKVVFSIALLAGLIYYIDIRSLVTSFANADAVFLSIGVILAGLQLVVHFFRWRYLLRLVSAEISNDEAVTSLFVGFMAGFFTPAQLGEFAGRIASHPTVNRSHIVGITLLDKLYWAALTFIIGGSGFILFIAAYMQEYWHAAFAFPAFTVVMILIGIFLLPEKMRSLLQFLPEKIRQHKYYEMILVIEEKFHNRQGRVLFGLTSLLYLLILLEYYFLANAFGAVPLYDAVMCGAGVFFVKAVILPISFGDLGIRESAAVFFFERAGSTAAVAFNASIVMSFANVIIPTAIGAVMVTRLRRK